jgi:hypothetical protein
MSDSHTGLMNESSCSIVGFLNSSAVSMMKSVQLARVLFRFGRRSRIDQVLLEFERLEASLPRRFGRDTTR